MICAANWGKWSISGDMKLSFEQSWQKVKAFVNLKYRADGPNTTLNHSQKNINEKD